MKLFLLIGSVVMFILTAILAFIGSITVSHLIGFDAIAAAAFASTFLPIP